MQKGKAIKSVLAVTQRALCCACGGCVSLCPVKAISIKSTPAGFLQAQVDANKCIGCGRCLKGCPSVQSNAEELLQSWQGNWHEGKSLIGYVGHATDEAQRLKGQSGGVVTGLLSWLMERGMIECAAVANFSTVEQRPQAVLAYTPEEIRKSAGSYYVHVPMLNAASKVKNRGKMAVVCTGCQSQAVHLSEEKLGSKRPYLIVGLVCEGVYSMGMLDELAEDKSKIREFRYRDKRNGGWPGGVYVSYDNNKTCLLPIQRRIKLKPYYASYRCLQCTDMNNIYADIVCGDPWFLVDDLSKESRYRGETVVVARSERGRAVLQAAVQAGILELQEISGTSFFYYNSFVEGRVSKNCAVQAAVRYHNLPQLYPNVNLLDTLPTSVRAELQIPRNIDKQVLFAWAHQNVKTVEEAAKMVQGKKDCDKIKQVVHWPFLFCIRIINNLYKMIKFNFILA